MAFNLSKNDEATKIKFDLSKSDDSTPDLKEPKNNNKTILIIVIIVIIFCNQVEKIIFLIP